VSLGFPLPADDDRRPSAAPPAAPRLNRVVPPPPTPARPCAHPPRSRAVTERYLARDPDEEIRKAFRLFDEDGTGKISVRALKRVAKELGEALSDDELAAMIEEFDADGDGMINEEEFTYIMKQTSVY
jgi:hypothetical protein